jgi:hypothetical protein
MKSLSRYLALLAWCPLLASPPIASAAETLRLRGPLSAVVQTLVRAADGTRRVVLSRQPGPRALPAAEPASATAKEIALGTTPAIEIFSDFRESVALLTDGTYASVWTDWDGPKFDVRTQWVGPDGSLVFASGGTLVGEADNPFEAAVIANPAGGAFVAYALGQKDPDIVNVQTDFRQVFVQSYDAAGNPLWPSGGVFAMNVDPASFQDQLHMAPAPGGGVYVCASESHSFVANGDLSDIRCQRLGAGGERLWTDQGINAGGMPGWKVLPKLVPDGHDGVMGFWSNKRDAFDHPKDRSLIEGQHFTAQGVKTWGPQGRILRTAGLGASVVSSPDELGAVSDGRGGAVLSFDDWSGRGALALDVYAQRVNGAGRVLWGRGAAVATGDTQQQNDSITAAPDGGAFITVWEPHITSEPAPDLLSLYRLGPDGKVLWKRQLASPASDAVPSDWGAYGSFDGGLLRLAWTHQRQQGAGDIDLRLVVFDLAGHPLNGPSGAPLTTDDGAQVLRGLAFDPARKQGFAVWLDQRAGDNLDVSGGFFGE